MALLSRHFRACGSLPHWAWAGDGKSRTAVTTGTNKYIIVEEGDDIPKEADLIFVDLHRPLKYPKNCPRITQEMLDWDEYHAPMPYYNVVQHGKLAFFQALMDGKVPRNCTAAPFPMKQLGGVCKKCSEIARSIGIADMSSR